MDEDWRTLYPYDSRSHLVADVRMNYVDEGQGPPLLMVHGDPTWSFVFRRLIADLSSTHRCVAPDHVGCGLSDKPRRWSYRLEDHIGNLSQLIERKNQQLAGD